MTQDEIKEVRDRTKDLIKKVRRLFNRHSKNMADNNDSTSVLLMFLDKYPTVFADEFGVIERDMLKWALDVNTKNNQLLIDKIKEIETEYNLPLHGIDDCIDSEELS